MPPSSYATAPLSSIGRWAWYSLPVAAILATLSLWSASHAPSEESTRRLHERHIAEWQMIRNITGR